MNRFKRLLCLTVCIAIIAVLSAGCGGKSGTGTAAAGSTENLEPAVNFTGSVLELSFYTNGIQTPVTPKNDVVGPEVIKATGIKWKSVEGLNGQDNNQRMNVLIQSDSLPDVCLINFDQKYIDNDLFWKIKPELLNKYAPEIDKRLGAGERANMLLTDNTFAGFPAWMSMSEYDKQISPDFPAAVGDWLEEKAEYSDFLVRDDILKAIFPQAMTEKELEDYYAANKKITQEQIKVAGLETSDDFFNFLRKVKALGLKNGEKDVVPFCLDKNFINENGYPGMMGLFGAYSGTYVSAFYNPNDNDYQCPYLASYYKDILKKWNSAAKEGLFDVNIMIMKPEQVTQKALKGDYAVLPTIFGNPGNPNKALERDKKPYRYRLLEIKPQLSHYYGGFMTAPAGPSGYYFINKKTVKESDLPKIANYLNFFLTKEGAELITWGPESAGLWTVGSDGKRHFKDKDLEYSALNPWAPPKPNAKDCRYYGIMNGSSNASGEYYCYYNYAGWTPYAPLPQAWPLPKTYTADEFMNISQVDSTRHRYYLDDMAGCANGVEWGAATTKLYNETFDVVTNTLPRLIFAKNDSDFESLYQKAYDQINGKGEWENAHKLYMDAYTKFAAAHPDLKPIPFPVK